ncbi:MAG: DUF1223 domain-containing protein [Acidiphilium sp.]|nr:DUF1223 domain-containing protein [Acidiphilium sp.]MDD4934938.1 DUF1223 domain-containing protein [Acidiphilium sp.]
MVPPFGWIMRRKAPLAIATGLVAMATIGPWTAFETFAAADSSTRTTQIIEFYTSDACANCLAADKVVSALSDDAGVIVLSFHVSYWDYLGWKDKFGLAAAAALQKAYAKRWNTADIFTPQVIVDGEQSGTGASAPELRQLMAMAPKIRRLEIVQGKANLRIILPHMDGAKGATVWVAAFDRRRIVRVERGENAHRVVTETDIVRSITPIRRVTGVPVDITVPTEMVGKHRGVAAFLQCGKGGKIIAAGSLVLPASRS